jgi:hypothetical protein
MATPLHLFFARLGAHRIALPPEVYRLPDVLNEVADSEDIEALCIARDAAELAAIGRTVYGALVEDLREKDGQGSDRTYREMLSEKISAHDRAAEHFDLTGVQRLISVLPDYVVEVLKQMQEYAREGEPEAYKRLLPAYRHSEVRRKGSQACATG